MIRLRIELARLTVELIVDLPADEARMLPVVPDQLLHDAGCKFAVDRRIVVVVAPSAVAKQHAVLSGVQNLRVLLGKPGRRRRARRPEDHLDSLFLRNGKKLIKKVK